MGGNSTNGSYQNDRNSRPNSANSTSSSDEDEFPYLRDFLRRTNNAHNWIKSLKTPEDVNIIRRNYANTVSGGGTYGVYGGGSYSNGCNGCGSSYGGETRSRGGGSPC